MISLILRSAVSQRAGAALLEGNASCVLGVPLVAFEASMLCIGCLVFRVYIIGFGVNRVDIT